MIALRKMNGQEMVLNADLIESIESTPDTVLTLTTGKKLLVKNSIEDIVQKTVKYKQLTHQALQVVKRENTGESVSPIARTL
jgi:flagellar protein FlbD